MPSYLVVGSSRGIGLEFVCQLAVNPDNTVFATARNKQTATHLNAFIGAHPHSNVHVLELDIVDFRTLQNAAAEAAKITNGTLDVLIHNAARLDGPNMLRTLLDYPSEEELHKEFMEAFEVNTLGGIHAVNAFLPLLRNGTSKKIIFMGGDAAARDFIFKTQLAEMPCLFITKYGQKMVALKYAVQLKDEGFTVVTVSPGWVDTSATSVSAGAPPSAEDAAKLQGLFGRMKAAYPNVETQTPEAAVRRLLERIDQVGPADSGSSYSGYGFDGEEDA